MAKHKNQSPKKPNPLQAPPLPSPVSRKKDLLVLITLIALVSLGAILRFFYLIQLQGDPLPEAVVGWEAFDQYRFMLPAKEFLQGNWLGSTVPNYSLGYPYLIALLYSVFPHHTNTLFFFQILCGLGAVYLFYRTAVLLFSNKILGLIAAGAAAFYSPFLFQECDMERGALIAYFNLLGFYLLLRALRKFKKRTFFFGGLAVGLSLILRVNVLPLFIAPYLLFAIKKPRKWAAAALFLAGVVAVVSPLALRNKIVGNTFAIEYQGFKTFWLGNAPDVPGVGFVDLPSSIALDKESQGSIVQTMKLWVREIKKYPRLYRGLYGRKIKMFLGAYEAPANLSYDLFKENHSALRISFLDFGIICPLALVGIFLARRRIPYIGLLYLFLGVVSISNILFHIMGRYRIPAVPFFILLAAYAVYGLIDMLRKKKFLQFFCAIVALALLSWYTRPDETIIRYTLDTRIRVIDRTNFAEACYLKAVEERTPKDQKVRLLEMAIAHLKKVVAQDPRNEFAFEKMAVDYFAMDRKDEAREYLQKALALHKVPTDDERFNKVYSTIANQMAVDAASAGRLQEAIESLQKLIEVCPRYAPAYFNLGIVYLNQDDKEKAILFLEKAVAINPNYSMAYQALSTIYRSLGKEQEASNYLQKAKDSENRQTT